MRKTKYFDLERFERFIENYHLLKYEYTHYKNSFFDKGAWKDEKESRFIIQFLIFSEGLDLDFSAYDKVKLYGAKINILNDMEKQNGSKEYNNINQIIELALNIKNSNRFGVNY